MSSIFDLPKSAAELASANQGTANARYVQITPLRDISGTNFPKGVIQWRWETGGLSWFVPSLSHLRGRFKITACHTDGTPLTSPPVALNIAPAMGFMSTLFKYFDIRVGGRTVHKIQERLPQIDALNTRMKRSKAWLDSIGKDTNFWHPKQEYRAQQLGKGGYIGDNVFPLMGVHRNEYIRYTPANLNWAANPQLSFVENTRTLTFTNMNIMTTERLDAGDIIETATHAFKITEIQNTTQAFAQVELGAPGNVAGPDAILILHKINVASSNTIQAASSFECIWQPPLGFFDLPHAVPPGGEWVMETYAQPETSWEMRAVECPAVGEHIDMQGVNSMVPLLNENNTFKYNYRIEVENIYFYLYTVESLRFDNGYWFMDIPKVICQLVELSADSTGLVQKNFDITGKTNALTMAFQDREAGRDTRYSITKFKMRRSLVAPQGQEMLLSRFFIQYNHKSRPQPDFDGIYDVNYTIAGNPQTQRIAQRYVETIMQQGGYHQEGGSETLDDWISRGPYYYFVWPKDAFENNTRVNINLQFSDSFDDAGHILMLFNHFRTAYRVAHNAGRIDALSIESL